MMWLTRRSGLTFSSIGLGMLLSSILVCAIPLMTSASMTLALQHTLSQSFQNDIVVAYTPLSIQNINTITPLLDAQATAALSPYVTPQNGVTLSIQSTLNAQTQVIVTSFPDSYLAYRFGLISGQFPSDTAAENEVVLTQATAAQLNAKLGMQLMLRVHVFSQSATSEALIPLRIVGIVQSLNSNLQDPYDKAPIDPIVGNNNLITVTVLTNTPVFSRIAETIAKNVPDASAAVQATWVYQIPANQVTASNYAQIEAGVKIFYQHFPQIFISQGLQSNNFVYGNALPSLKDFSARTAATQFPLTAIAVQIGVLLLWFMLAFVELLIDYNEQTLAVLRSRGASAWQLMSGLLLPLLTIAVIVGGAGPWIAAQLILGLFAVIHPIPELAKALNASQPWQLLTELKWYSITGVAAAFLISAVTLYHKLAVNIVVFRRKMSRAAQNSFWRRYPFDLLAAVALLAVYVSYAFFIAPLVGPETYAQVAPLALYTPILALTACVIVLFRLFPWLFKRTAILASRWRGAVPILANANLVQSQNIARKPAIFLALAIALVCFISSYQATRIQHNQEYAAFQVGSDFSFSLPIDTNHVLTYQQQEARFLTIHGVQAASAGALLDVFPQTTSSSHDRILAVDAQTFGTVAAWQDTSAQPTMAQLLHQLVQTRSQAIRQLIIPAIVDDAMWRQYQLATNSEFSLDLSGVGTLLVHFQVIGHVQYLPTVSAVASDTSQNILGGMLVDFSTLAQVIPQIAPQESTPPGYIWLKTSHNPQIIAQIRATLQRSPYSISVFQDRFQLIADMAYDPLSLALQATTLIGAGITLLLALLMSGQLLWNSLQKRLLNLTALYALGAARHQIAAIIILEDGLQLLLAAGIGILLGALLTGLIAPLMAFAQSSDTSQPIVDLMIPPPQIVFPWQWIFAGTGIFLLIAIFVMSALISVNIKGHIAAALRLNED